MAKAHHVFLNLSFLFLVAFFIKTQPSLLPPRRRAINTHLTEQQGCRDFDSLEDSSSKCAYLRTTDSPCAPPGYVDYLYLFYCLCGDAPPLGYALLSLCLLLLFYVLGDTASRYFCSSLDSLSKILGLSPAIAGVTLLSLGNGAPDVFSTIVSFASSSSVGDVGLSSVLGGAFFVSSVVVGVISVAIGSFSIPIDRSSFVRDVCFLLLVLCCLLAVLVVGEIGVAGAVLFASLYVAYVVAVSASSCWRWSGAGGGLEVPLLDGVEVEEPPACVPKEVVRASARRRAGCCVRSLRVLELPLYLPRRLTIPDVSEERWSKPYAAASVVLAPILLAALWDTRQAATEEADSEGRLTTYLFAGLVGLVLGMVALETTESSKPPNKFLLPWLAGGFLMSVVWTYITAGELVSLLVSIGHVLGISPSVLGVTVLAWGNSVGDLIANVAMALNGGEDGAQVAISGCYAGPIFNTLVGLGLSLVLSAWNARPAPYVIPGDSSLFVTLGFLMAGLLWALAVLPRRGMKLDRVVGIGLLAIYVCFLCLRISQSVGLVQICRQLLHGSKLIMSV
ncbi:cation/calcium exchanger 1-like [Iris pallida]|uniref:Cation/calcium exchanger 1-like n=1 Tax=Iris pallida TaxID=29817 RepID=A0AAX6FKW1_IRIPA|nr:cation/calcium exchanger 1-like [Iris pallida]